MKSLERISLEAGYVHLIKIVLLLLTLSLSFSDSLNKRDEKLAQRYFQSGYQNLQIGNFKNALIDFSMAYSFDKKGPYGELAYLYLGKTYTLLSYRTGNKEGVFSSIAYLNMYTYHYKNPNYLLLKDDFVGESYLLLGFYERAFEVFMKLYKDSSNPVYLLKALYAEASQGKSYNYELLNNVKPENLKEEGYLYYLVKGFYEFNLGNYTSTLENLSLARSMKAQLGQDPDFLYRQAAAYALTERWKEALQSFEVLSRVDIYKTYSLFSDYYLTLIHLKTKNYIEAKERLYKLIEDYSLFNPVVSLLYYQLWAYDGFVEKYLPNYKDSLTKVIWINSSSDLSIPALLGIYYYSIKERKILSSDIFKMFPAQRVDEVTLSHIKADLKELYIKLFNEYSKLDPYSPKDGTFLLELLKASNGKCVNLLGAEKFARAGVYFGAQEAYYLINLLQEPLKSFFYGQVQLLQGKEEGLKLIEEVLKDLKDDDRREALFILGLYRRREDYLLEALKGSLTERLEGYAPLALLTLGEIYEDKKDYNRAKVYYKEYLQKAQEDTLYWIVAYKLAYISSITNDKENLNWVVNEAKKTDNIIGRIIRELWG